MLRQLVANAGGKQDNQLGPPTSGEALLSIKENPTKGRGSISVNNPNASPRHSISMQPRPSISVSNLPRPSIAPRQRGASLIGLLASKKFAKQLTSRFSRRRFSSFVGGSSKLSHDAIAKEPSYRMTPQRKFDCKKVETCIKDVLEDKLENFHYNPKFCANMCKILCEEIKAEVKAMNFDRYKIVCSVNIIQRRGQGVSITSRCAWDDKLDNVASYTFKNEKILCTAICFGIYNE